MKKILLLLTLATASIGSSAQAVMSVALPPAASTSTQLRAPNGLATMTTFRAHFIIPSSEMALVPNGVEFTDFALVYTGGTNGVPAGGTFTIYMENTSDATNLKSTTWSTAIGTMSTVYTGPYNLPTGDDITPAIVNVTLSSPFTYTGGGLYIAYDYLGTSFSTLPATNAANNDLVSATMSGSSSTTTPPATVSQSSDYRPQIQLSFDNPFNNEVQVVSMEVGKGHESGLLNASDSITAVIKNASNTGLTNIPVNLTITGANAVTQTQTIPSLAAGLSTSLVFTGISTANTGAQEIEIRVPADQVTYNDSLTFNQLISCDTLGYSNNSAPVDGIGYGTGSGILAARYKAPSNFPLSVKGINVGLYTGTSIVGNDVYGVILDSLGNILAATSAVTVGNADLGTEMTFTFDEPVIIGPDTTFYVGLAQTATVGLAYYPVSTQAPVIIPADRIFSIPLPGGTPVTISNLGTLMIEAIVAGQVKLTSDAASDSLCEGTEVMYSATEGYTSYDFQVNGASMQNTAAGSYDMELNATSAVSVNALYNGCVSVSDNDTLTAIPTNVISIQISGSENDICEGTEVTFSADVTNEGTAPIYQWKVNGAEVSTDASYTYAPADEDTVSVYLLSDVICPSKDTAFSNEIYMDVNPIVAPTVTISADPGVTLTEGQQVTFTATPTDGGTAPQYQWRKNGEDIPSETTDEYTATAGTEIMNGDEITVLLNSSAACVDPDSANSNTLTLDISQATGIKGVAGQLDMKVYPNPGNGDITLTGKWHTAKDKAVALAVFNSIGQQVYMETIAVNSGMQTYALKLSGRLQPGTYMLKVSGEQSAAMKFVVMEK